VFAILVRFFFSARFFVHCRTLVIGKRAISGRLSNYLWDRFDSRFIAIDKNVAASLPQEIQRSKTRIKVIHNGFKLEKRQQLDLRNKVTGELFKVGFVGGLHRAKGCYELTQAIINLKKSGRNVCLTIVGDDIAKDLDESIKIKLLKYIGLYQDISRDIFQLVSSEQHKADIKFTGFKIDIEKYYKAFDVIAFPSYYDAPGRPIFEGALLGVPSIAAISKPEEDTFRPNETGLQIKPKSVKEIELAIEYMMDNPEKYNSMCMNAFKLAWKNFDIKKNSIDLINYYNLAD